ncbi:hypothetical protein AVEN_60245-1 [Araneus ventricosus]|uniref:Uncharacterized protein n=1 Tax=Araneus ventricosus TaxID=182803 RepID=A0A4Y2THW8_ARAVE|nr:hypothetical protein AVEN_60245-1 [Araneus ventricosus]
MEVIETVSSPLVSARLQGALPDQPAYTNTNSWGCQVRDQMVTGIEQGSVFSLPNSTLHSLPLRQINVKVHPIDQRGLGYCSKTYSIPLHSTKFIYRNTPYHGRVQGC